MAGILTPQGNNCAHDFVGRWIACRVAEEKFYFRAGENAIASEMVGMRFPFMDIIYNVLFARRCHWQGDRVIVHSWPPLVMSEISCAILMSLEYPVNIRGTSPKPDAEKSKRRRLCSDYVYEKRKIGKLPILSYKIS